MKCLVKECKKEAITRGLCKSCYPAAYKLVTTGKTTWEELEERGLSGGPLRIRGGLFLKAFKKSQ